MNKNKELVLLKVEEIYNYVVNIVISTKEKEKENYPNNSHSQSQSHNQDYENLLVYSKSKNIKGKNVKEKNQNNTSKNNNSRFRPCTPTPSMGVNHTNHNYELDNEEDKNISIINKDFKKNLISESDQSPDNSIEKIVFETPDTQKHKYNNYMHHKNSKSVHEVPISNLNLNNQKSSKKIDKKDAKINSLEKEVKNLKNQNKAQEDRIKESCKNLASKYVTIFDKEKESKEKLNNNLNVNKSLSSNKNNANEKIERKNHKKSASVDCNIDWEFQQFQQPKLNLIVDNNTLFDFKDKIPIELMRIDESVNSYINTESKFKSFHNKIIN